MLGMFAVMAELERDIITEQLLENRIARAKKGFPVGGKPPAGRIYNRQNRSGKLMKRKPDCYVGRLNNILRGLHYGILL